MLKSICIYFEFLLSRRVVWIWNCLVNFCFLEFLRFGDYVVKIMHMWLMIPVLQGRRHKTCRDMHDWNDESSNSKQYMFLILCLLHLCLWHSSMCIFEQYTIAAMLRTIFVHVWFLVIQWFSGSGNVFFYVRFLAVLERFLCPAWRKWSLPCLCRNTLDTSNVNEDCGCPHIWIGGDGRYLRHHKNKSTLVICKGKWMLNIGEQTPKRLLGGLGPVRILCPTTAPNYQLPITRCNPEI